MSIFGYVRVSDASQNEDRQIRKDFRQQAADQTFLKIVKIRGYF